MISKTRKSVSIPRREWDKLRKNPAFGDLIELLEDRLALQEAMKATGKDMSPAEYLKKRGIRNTS